MISRQLIVAAVAGLASQAYVADSMAHGSRPQEEQVEVVATGLHSPRGLDFASNGQLYVTETGDWANGPCRATGAVSRIDLWKDAASARVPVLTGLPSYGDNGAADISFLGMQGYVVIGLAADPNVRATQGSCGALLGSVIRINPPYQSYKYVSDISEFERSYNNEAGNPDNGTVLVCHDVPPPGFGQPCMDQTSEESYDTNPFGILAEHARLIVSDAGANDLIEVRANGKKRLLATFPAEGDYLERVPSRVVRGPDGYLYVGEEAFDAGPGEARVYRVPPDGCQPVDECEVYADGFTSVMDLDFDRKGNLYVLETFVFGQATLGNLLIKVDRRRNKTTIDTTVPDPTPTNPDNRRNLLALPGGLTLSPNGDYAYITNKAACFGGAANLIFLCSAGDYGELLRVRLDDDSGHHGKWN